jgi:thymidine kinase
MAKLEIMVGPMFASKSTELLRRLFTVAQIGKKALYINNSIDVRNAHDVFSTHNPQLKATLSDLSVKMISVRSLDDVNTNDIITSDIIGIDEAQFFPSLELVKVMVDKYKKHVIVVGLDGDANRQLFGEIYKLLPYCDSIVKLSAFCVVCGTNGKLTNAIHTKYIGPSASGNISVGNQVGNHDKYQSVCRECYLSQ